MWLISGAVVGLHVLLGLQNLDAETEAVREITADGMIERFPGIVRPAREALVEYLAASSFQMCLFLPCVAAVVAGQEFRAGQLGTSLLAVPRRGLLAGAKVLAVGGFLLFVSIVIAAISTAFVYLSIKDWNPGLPVSAEAWTAQVKFLAYAVLSGLTTFAITMIARSTLIGILVTVALTVLTMSQILAVFTPALDALVPLSAGRNLILVPDESLRLSAGPGHAMVVLVTWPLLATAVAATALCRRDAR
ncbi:ABC transporter permease [Planobispora siamensis]|uniref:ABC transporter permease n=1 Tax=Planobispora siamensis TaxID=936338 RepID=UPI00194E2789|nr:ABC transporter permease [Planobispora siamensis]